MAQIIADSLQATRRKTGVQRMKKHRLVIDMTPMVDLSFLLIAFFVITAELSKPAAMSLAMPKDGGPPSELCNSCAMTLLLNGETNYYYEGAWEIAIKEKRIKAFRTEELRQQISRKQIALDDTVRFSEGRAALMLLVKPTANASYKTVVDVLDEATITGVKKYAILKISKEEQQWLNSREEVPH